MNSSLQAASPEYQSELFESTKLVYEDTFEGTLNQDFWEVRQSSTWKIKNGVLTGSQSSREFQKKKIAAGDKAHAGFKPVIWLKQVPENFVCTMRMRYNAKTYHPRFPLLDLGHHSHTLTFGEQQTKLTIKKDVETTIVKEQFLPPNQWVDVVIELKQGTLLLIEGNYIHHRNGSNVSQGDGIELKDGSSGNLVGDLGKRSHCCGSGCVVPTSRRGFA